MTKPTRDTLGPLHDEAGFAMVTVVGVATVLFLLLTTMFVLTNYRTMQSSHYVSRMQAMQLADAGLNFYLYRLGVDYTYYSNTPTPTPSLSTPQGSWAASATYDTTTKLVTIRSVGLANDGSRRTVVAKCSPPPPPMYAIGSGGNIDVGKNTLIDGPMRSNGYVHIATGGTVGKINGLAQSGVLPTGDFTPKVGGVPDPARFIGGASYYPALSFDKMSTDVAEMKAVAGLKLGTSRADGKTPSALGYQITIAGNQVGVRRVTAEARTYSNATQIANLGSLTTTVPPSVTTTYAIPSTGVIFIDGDNVWVSGTYSARVTICAGRVSSSDTTYGNITVTDSVICVDPDNNPTRVCGLMAQNNIWLPDWYSRTNMDPTLEIQAALLAQYGTIGDNIPSGLSGNNVFYNSTTQTSAHDITTTVLNGDTSGIVSSKYPYHDLDLAGSALGCTGVGFSVDYFITRSYGFDDRLKTSPPPYWPSGDSKWVLVSSWLEN